MTHRQPPTATMWHDTMGRDGNPLGRLRAERIEGNRVAELHDETVITDGARIDVFAWTHDRAEAEIPRTHTHHGKEWVGGWNRLADQSFATYEEAREVWDANDNAALVEVLADDE